MRAWGRGERGSAATGGRRPWGKDSDAHDVVAAVDVEDLAGDRRGHRRDEEERGVADLAQLDVAPERRLFGVVLEHARVAPEAEGVPRVDWSLLECDVT